MTSATTRNSLPAATRTGRCAVALPNDPGLDEILADPTLSSTAKAIVAVMVKNWAWSKDHCWPSDQTLAAKVGKSPGQVQRCLLELEQAGWIRRERTDAVPNGRRIWLLWRCPGGREGAQREFAKARSVPAAPARSEQIVLVNGQIEPGIQLASRQRSEADSTPAAADSPASPTADEATTLSLPSPGSQEPCRTPAEPKLERCDAPSLQVPSGATGGRSSDPAPLPVPADPIGPPAMPDLGAIGRPESPSPATSRIPRRSAPAFPVPCSAPTAETAPRRKRLGLTLEELIKVVGETADPILAKELARRTAPPAPPEPPPQALPTADLLAKLPGRHDLISEATRRLAVELADFKPASVSFFEKAVEAVATRSVKPEVLLDCRRQATGPTVKNPGSVFVVSWKREVEMRR